MAVLSSKEFLDLLLEGYTLTPSELQQFIQEHPAEDQYFDYKDGAITTPQRRKEGSQIIRKWINGFANSEGGVLIVGVDENKPRKIVGCEPSIGGQTLDEWANRCLLIMSGYFSPPPRFKVIQHADGPVLIIAVARAPSFVPCVEAGELKYFLRIHESTVEAPAYLISDLVLGRRQHPILNLHIATIHDRMSALAFTNSPHRVSARDASFNFDIENLSLATAAEITIGVISWSLVESEREELNENLRLYLDIVDVPSMKYPPSWIQLIHRSSIANQTPLTLAPFHKGLVGRLGHFYLPHDTPLKVTCAVYVIPKGAPPTWFQLEFESLVAGIPLATGTLEFKPRIIRKGHERPKIAWEITSWPR